jgi:hypothetical protein
MRKIIANFPAISREVEFIARHTDEADAIYFEKIAVVPALKKLSDAVYDRADSDVLELLKELQDEVCRGVKSHVRVGWRRIKRGDWENSGSIYMARGRKKRIGYIGLFVGYGQMPLRLIAWVYPSGGLDGRRELTDSVRKKAKMPVQLVSDNMQKYPSWTGDGVIWFDKQVTLKTSRTDLASQLATMAKRFFKLAKPLLKKLAAH